MIKEYMDEREIKYIIDYAIDPIYFMKYINCPGFLAYHINYYNEAANHFYYLNDYEIVDIVEKILAKNIDLNSVYDKYAYYHYDALLKEFS